MCGLSEKRIDELIELYRSDLLDNVVPFWMRHAVDRKFGGFITCLDRDGTIIDTDKNVWQQGRGTWLFAKLYNEIERRDEWLNVARRGVEFLDTHCFDPKDGRMWFHVTREGQPIRKRRYAYSESFAAIAYGEFAKATASKDYAEKAKRSFQRFVDHNLNPQGVEPKFTDTRPTRDFGFPMITINTAQELRNSIGLESADEWIDSSIDSIRRYHVHQDIECVLETVDRNGQRINHFDGRRINPGHAIEGAWFIMEEGRYRNDLELTRLGCTMLDWMWKRGWDSEYGGIFYFVDVNGLPVQEYWHDMKFWWPHNEAIIATLLAWSLTGDRRYADWHTLVHDWSYKNFADPVHGEWFGYLHRDSRLSVPLKGSFWKGPFHLPRMLLECWQILSRWRTR